MDAQAQRSREAALILMTAQKSILLVEDDPLLATVLGAQIEDMGYHLCGTARSAYRAIAMARTFRPDIILMDMQLEGDVDGVDAARVISETTRSRIIFITGSRDPATLKRLEMVEHVAVLFKPFAAGLLRKTIDRIEPG